ncbi:MAG TPA: PIN domain-containing protein [Terriglobales bacterium]|nr:PIN domain-containing protein [Terriglobales bacterium]
MDSSVWIDFFSSTPGTAGAELHRMIADSEAFALSGIIVAEILQGLTRNVRRIEEYLMQWDLLEPAGFDTFRSAAAIYRMARQRGITPTTIDTIIATIALEHGAAVFTLDKDFNQIAKITGLTLYAF